MTNVEEVWRAFAKDVINDAHEVASGRHGATTSRKALLGFEDGGTFVMATSSIGKTDFMMTVEIRVQHGDEPGETVLESSYPLGGDTSDFVEMVHEARRVGEARAKWAVLLGYVMES